MARNAELSRAIDLAGGVSALAKALGLDHSTVSGWRQLPAARVGAVAALTGLDPQALRPDLFAAPGGLAEAQAPYAAEARALGLDPEAIAGKAIQDAIQAEKQRRWLEENREAIEAWNDWVDNNELPLARYRMF